MGGEMRRITLGALALCLCACGDGRIERAFNSVPAYYPASTTSSDTFETFQAKQEADWQQAQVESLQSQFNDFQNYHPELF